MANYFKVGDPILFGKYKNKPGIIVRFFKDGRGLPYVEVEPVPKGRKKNREIGLFNIWHQDVSKRASVQSVYKPLSEISPRVQNLLDTPTPSGLDRKFPYVAPPTKRETLKELDYLVSLMPKREAWKSFIEEADADIVGLFADLCEELGSPCDEEALREKMADASVLITKLKWLYNRPRPYQVAAEHNRLGGQGGIWKEGDFSPMPTVSGHTPAYPSGHTIQAALVASHLAAVAPQHRRSFMDLAHKISFSRAVAGLHWPSDLVFGQDIFRHIVSPEMPSSVKVAAKFKSKKQVPKADGSGTTTVYEYGPRQVLNRNRAKAERVERLRTTIGKLRKQIRKDLTSEDPKVRLAALAVALIDQTYERVGNEKSATENGHYGITTLTTDHIKMGNGKATLSYVGKSGVEHTKTVTDKATLAALKEALKGRGKGDRVLCDGEECTIRARDVNAYLRDFDITAKDLRGMHANEEMRKRMTQIRKKGPELPRARKERDKILKAEFKEALEGTSEAVGHKASTLKSQYLVPGMEDAYLKDGTVIDKLHKKAVKKYEHIDFKPPKTVADAAKKGLELREKASPSNRGGLTTEQAGQMGIGSGVQRAVNLKNRNTLTPATIKKMNGFFSRHEQNKNIAPENKGKPWNDKGYVSWLLWGGDPGKSWAAKILKQMEAADEKAKKKASLSERWGFTLVEAGENEPTNPGLWAKVQALAKGEQKSFTHNGKTINGPNDGKGFKIFPSAYANGWASKTYGDLGGGWKKKARGKAKKDVGHGGLDEWFSGHGGAKGKGEEATWGDWVAISPVEKTLESGRKVKPGDIVGPCGISKDPDWKDVTDGGEDPLKCMPRDKAHDMPKKERAEKAKAKQKAEKADSSKGKKPTNTPTFEKKKASLEDQWGPMAIEASRLKTQVFLLGMPQAGKAPMGEFDENKLPKGRLRIKNRPLVSLEKPIGAFWTSSLKGNTSGWIEWCTYEMPHWVGNQAVLFKPKSGAKVLWIRSPQDYEDAVDRYPRVDKFGERGLDWEAVAKDYDAVTCPGGRCIYGWDAESTAWFNMNALQFERVVDVKHKCTIRDENEEYDDYWGPKKEFELKVGTKSDAEKEDEEAQRLVRNSPKNKPPRKDLERSRIKDHQDEDPDEKQDRKDRSLNFKDIAASLLVRRVAHRHLAKAVAEEESTSSGGVGGLYLEFLKEMGDKKVKNPDTGNEVKLKSLKGDKGKEVQQKEFEKWKASQESGSGSDGAAKGDTEKSELKKRVEDAERSRQDAQLKTESEVDSIFESLDHLNDSLSGSGVSAGDVGDFTPEQMQAFSSAFGTTSTKLENADASYRNSPAKRKALQKKVEGFRELLQSTESENDRLKQDPKKFAEALATVDYYERILNNPLVVPDNPISEKGGKLSGKELEQAKEEVANRSRETYTRYQGVDKETRDSASSTIEQEIQLLPEGSARRLQLEGMRAGLGVLSAVEDGDDFEGGPATQQLAKALSSTGNVGLLMSVAPSTMTDALSNQKEIRNALGEVSDKDWSSVLTEDAPGSPIAELLGDSEAGQYLTEDDRAFLREVLADEVMGGVAVIDSALAEKAPTSGSGRALMESRGMPAAAKKVQKQISEILGSDEFLTLVKEENNPKERKSLWESLVELLTGHRKETVQSVKESEGMDSRQDGDTWKSGDKWYGKKDGDTRSFDSEEGAKGFAKGGAISPLVRGYTFEVWGTLGMAEGQKNPLVHR